MATIDIFVFTFTFNFVTYNLGIISPKLLEDLDFQIEIPQQDVYTFEIFDISGKRFAYRKLNLNEGIHYQQLNLKESPKTGIYFIRISNSNGVVTQKFMR